MNIIKSSKKNTWRGELRFLNDKIDDELYFQVSDVRNYTSIRLSISENVKNKLDNVQL